MRKIRWFAVLLIAMLLYSTAVALCEEVSLRGYLQKGGYQRISFGAYPTQKDGEIEPVTWRILGIDDDGIACLMTEHIIDFIYFNEAKDTQESPLAYPDSLINQTCNETVVNALFTEAERNLLIPLSDNRGILSPASYVELLNTEYGFKGGNFTVDKNRQAYGTPYAYSLGLKRIGSNGQAWYWTTEWRRAGYRWIVGDDGHISVSGIDRKGGLRPVCYIDLSTAHIAGGEGTIDNPFTIEISAF